jgi:hypothetical protein
MAKIARVLNRLQPTIIWRHLDCNYKTDSYATNRSYCGEPIIGAGSRRTLWIYYNEYSYPPKRLNVYITTICDKEEALEGHNYILSANTYDPDSISGDSDFHNSVTSWSKSIIPAESKIDCNTIDLRFDELSRKLLYQWTLCVGLTTRSCSWILSTYSF